MLTAYRFLWLVVAVEFLIGRHFTLTLIHI